MLRSFTRALLTSALLAATAATGVHAGSATPDKLCALPTASLVEAAQKLPEYAFALNEVKSQAIATWYTDREPMETCTSKVNDIVAHCDESTRMTLVVYGMPDKDCHAGFSAGGINKNAEDYKKWVQTLADGVGNRKVLYVLEPDAVGLLTNGGCGATKGYAKNVQTALEILSKNPNADIYLDVGYWTLKTDEDSAEVAKTVKELAAGGRLKGISLNTSNYRSNKQMSELCGNFQRAYGDQSLHCIVDTSRNYNEPSSWEWCNAKFGGIGRPPTTVTEYDNLDYYIWIKPAGESDGECNSGDHTTDVTIGPAAGAFFKEHFVSMWNNGYFVKEKNFPRIDDGQQQDKPATSSAPPVPSSTPTETPVAQETPAPETTTQAPVVSATPSTTSPTPTEPVSETPVPSPSQVTSSPSTPATPVATTPAPDNEESPTPVYQFPVTTAPAPAPGPAPGPVRESGEIAPVSALATPAPTSAPTPAATHTATTTTTKKPKKSKKCESGLEPLPEDLEAEAAADAKMTNNTTAAKAVETPAAENAAREAPAVVVGLAPVQEVSTKTQGAEATGLGGGVVAIIVIAGVVAVAVGAVAFRRSAESRRRRSHTLRTPVEAFGQLQATPAQVTVL